MGGPLPVTDRPAGPAAGRGHEVGGRPRASYEDLVAEALARPFVGWDFAWLGGRAPITATLPWDYRSVVAALAEGATRMLDMGTGGGEVLSRLAVRARGTVADEAWAPNVPVAAARLRPLGISVVRDEGAPDNFDQDGVRGRLPYRDGAFDLVINRHESFLATEVTRVLGPGGHFVTQQVDHHSYDDFYAALGLEAPAEPETWVPLARRQLESAGLLVTDARRGEEHQAFGDVGALVWYLRAVPWGVPEFDLDACEAALRRIHRITGEGPVMIRQRRLLVVAQKPGRRDLLGSFGS